MPYIKKEMRPVAIEQPMNCGELNFVITSIIIKFCKDRGISYQTINDVLGAVEGAKTEFYARVAAPYEETKLISNGDVYVDLFEDLAELSEDWAFPEDDLTFRPI